MVLNSSSVARFIEESEFSKRAQCGIDLSLKKVNKISSNVNGFKKPNLVLKNKTIINPETYVEIIKLHLKEQNVTGWMLEPGVYDFQFNEKITLDEVHCGLLLQRSSLPRTCGGISSKSLFDPGFHTGEHTIGSTFIINETVFIEENACVAQMIILRSELAEKYEGQFIGEKQKDIIGK